MKTIFDPTVRAEVSRRLRTLTPDRAAQWGRFTAPRMVCHLAESCRMALGELPVAPKKLPIRHWPLNIAIVRYLPFPKGAPTAPELVARPPAEWQRDVEDLASLLDRVGTTSPETAWPEHPAFGGLSGADWGVLVYRHTDHHLRQFGA